MNIETGATYTFRPTASDLTDLWGSKVRVLRPLTETEADLIETGPMYRIEAESGEQVDAFEDEIEAA